MRVIEVNMERCREIPEKNTLTNGIIRHDSHLPKSGVSEVNITFASPGSCGVTVLEAGLSCRVRLGQTNLAFIISMHGRTDQRHAQGGFQPTTTSLYALLQLRDKLPRYGPIMTAEKNSPVTSLPLSLPQARSEMGCRGEWPVASSHLGGKDPEASLRSKRQGPEESSPMAARRRYRRGLSPCARPPVGGPLVCLFSLRDSDHTPQRKGADDDVIIRDPLSAAHRANRRSRSRAPCIRVHSTPRHITEPSLHVKPGTRGLNGGHVRPKEGRGFNYRLAQGKLRVARHGWLVTPRNCDLPACSQATNRPRLCLAKARLRSALLLSTPVAVASPSSVEGVFRSCRPTTVWSLPSLTGMVPLISVAARNQSPCPKGATVAERLVYSPSTKAIRAQSPAGSLRIFACGNRAGRCRFLGDVPFPPPFHSSAASYSPESPSSALKTSMLRAVKISSFTPCPNIELLFYQHDLLKATSLLAAILVALDTTCGIAGNTNFSGVEEVELGSIYPVYTTGIVQTRHEEL
ncbi:hypothetical protein PR048_001278 [Dryococelus australis]|uniref:Uncharacterized protein n=1 Tax=Dryococelus australis TaxID=614101 RepID=A0ABQ9IGY1_9NEOP|nr:hypothetical protein PR048_001278 [Dryococelus australis]